MDLKSFWPDFVVKTKIEEANGRFSIGKNDEIQFFECVWKSRNFFFVLAKIDDFGLMRLEKVNVSSAELRYLLEIFPLSIFKLSKI